MLRVCAFLVVINCVVAAQPQIVPSNGNLLVSGWYAGCCIQASQAVQAAHVSFSLSCLSLSFFKVKLPEPESRFHVVQAGDNGKLLGLVFAMLYWAKWCSFVRLRARST